MITKEQLIGFEDGIAHLFHDGAIPYPIHFSGGNEQYLINLFDQYKIGPDDWVFSTWRSHYHYLLKGGSSAKLTDMILHGRSMHVMDKELNFFASAIVGGCLPIAAGVALGLKMRGLKARVFCFLGDGAEDQGVFYESVRYAKAFDLPILYIIEDNDLSVDTTKKERINNYCIDWPQDKVIRYHYKRKYPHVQTGQMVKEYM